MLIAGLFLLWRIYLFIIAYYTQLHSIFIPRFPYADVYLMPSRLPQWIWAWANFDGVHYLTIAKYGYMAQFTQAFFPLYPLFVRITGFILKDNFLIISGLILSNFLFLLTLVYFRRLLILDFNHKTIRWTILFLILFPTSFYFGALYTESLFLFFIFISFWFARNKNWWLCGIFAGMASATKITGIALLPALLYEWVINQSTAGTSKNKTRSTFIRILDIFRSPVLYLVPAGLFGYMVYLKFVFNDPLYFWHAQAVFGASREGSSIIFPLQTCWRYLKMLFSVPVASSAFFNAFLEFGSFLFVITCLIIGHLKKVRTSYLIFSWFSVLLPILTGTFSSLPRYVLVAFPVYIVLGTINNRLVKLILLFLAFILLTYLTSIFTRGLWVA